MQIELTPSEVIKILEKRVLDLKFSEAFPVVDTKEFECVDPTPYEGVEYTSWDGFDLKMDFLVSCNWGNASATKSQD